jgi:hypothetical protein
MSNFRNAIDPEAIVFCCRLAARRREHLINLGMRDSVQMLAWLRADDIGQVP